MSSTVRSKDTLGGLPEDAGGGARLIRTYVRFVAMILLIAGLLRACLILGITLDGQSFETLDTSWKAGTLALVFVDLFAAVGLWIGATWGPVMWAVAVLVECAMYTILADQFGTYSWRIALHLALFGIFLVLAGRDWYKSRQS